MRDHLRFSFLAFVVLASGCREPTVTTTSPAHDGAKPKPSIVDAAAPARDVAVRDGGATATSPDAGADVSLAKPYPVGEACSKPEALAAEKKSLPPRASWTPVVSTKQALHLRVPPGVFEVKDGADGLRLVSAQRARGLGGADAKDHVFQIRIVRDRRSASDVLRDRSPKGPLASAFTDEVFPDRDTVKFRPHPLEPIGSGAAAETRIGGEHAWMWVTGAEGYNTDLALVAVGPKDSAVVVADWNTSIMVGQPECWQRAILGGVMDSVVFDDMDGPRSKISTVAGDLEALRAPWDAGTGDGEIRLEGRTITRTALGEGTSVARANGPWPSFVRTFRAIGGFDEVVLVRWDGPGNACNGYGYAFLHIEKDGTTSMSEDIGWCGGPAAVVTVDGQKIRVTSPKHPPNRGSGEIPAKSWTWDRGKISKDR